MKNWWRTDEELMKNWWRTDEELTKNWWRTDEELVKNWWRTDEELMKNWWKTSSWSGLVWDGMNHKAFMLIYIYIKLLYCGWKVLLGGFWWVWWVKKGDRRVFGGSVDSGCHKLSENIWFVWSKTSYIGDKVGCDACPRRTTDGRTECEDRARILKQNSQLWCQ